MEDIGAHSWLQALTGRVNIVDQVHIGSQVTIVQTGWLIDMIVSEQPGWVGGVVVGQLWAKLELYSVEIVQSCCRVCGCWGSGDRLGGIAFGECLRCCCCYRCSRCCCCCCCYAVQAADVWLESGLDHLQWTCYDCTGGACQSWKGKKHSQETLIAFVFSGATSLKTLADSFSYELKYIGREWKIMFILENSPFNLWQFKCKIDQIIMNE